MKTTTIADRLPLRGDLQETEVLAREANYIGLNHYKPQQRLWSDTMRHRRRPGFGVSVAALPGNCCGAPLLIRAGRLDVLTLHPQKSVALARKFLGARPRQESA